jgi:MFS family permease
VALAIGTWSFMTAISGLAQNYMQLFAARIGCGGRGGRWQPSSHSIISDIFPPEKRATAISVYSTGVNIGILFGFLVGGWLNEVFWLESRFCSSWRAWDTYGYFDSGNSERAYSGIIRE